MNYSLISMHVYSYSKIVSLINNLNVHAIFFRYILPNTSGYRKCAEDF